MSPGGALRSASGMVVLRPGFDFEVASTAASATITTIAAASASVNPFRVRRESGPRPMLDDVPADSGGRVSGRIDADGEHAQPRLGTGRRRERAVEVRSDQRADVRAVRVEEGDDRPVTALAGDGYGAAGLVAEREVRRGRRRLEEGAAQRRLPAAAAGEERNDECERDASHRDSRLRITTRTAIASAQRTSTAATITRRSLQREELDE